LAGVDWHEVELSTKQTKSHERQLSGVEIALATVAKWPMAVLDPFLTVAKVSFQATDKPTSDSFSMPIHRGFLTWCLSLIKGRPLIAARGYP
jgi:hypothetical protein